ncbi:MAG: hypothetical protein ACM3Q1_15885 [Bacteroidales bacterium]
MRAIAVLLSSLIVIGAPTLGVAGSSFAYNDDHEKLKGKVIVGVGKVEAVSGSALGQVWRMDSRCFSFYELGPSAYELAGEVNLFLVDKDKNAYISLFRDYVSNTQVKLYRVTPQRCAPVSSGMGDTSEDTSSQLRELQLLQDRLKRQAEQWRQ